MKKTISLAAIALTAVTTVSTAQAGDIKVSGKVFADYSIHTAKGKSDQAGVTISRAYLTAKKKVNKTWSAKVTLDSALNSKHNGKKSEVFLKTAQLTGKFSKAFNVKVGLIGTPWIGYEDKLGKHRHVSKSFVDAHKMDSSADAGAGVFGKLMNGMISYDVVSVNGGGYGNTTITTGNDINVRVGVQPLKGLTLDFGYRNGYLGKGNTVDKTTLIQALVTYGNNIGDLSYRAAFNFINNDKVATTEKAQEAWAWVRMNQVGAYVRYENLDHGVAGSAKETRTVVSADYFAAKGIVLSAVYDATANSAGTSGNDKSKMGLFTKFAF